MSRTGTALVNKTPSHRYRYGAKNEVVVPVTTAKIYAYLEIAAGDMVYIAPTSNGMSQTAGICYPNSALSSEDGGSVSDWFLGVSLDSSANGDSDDITVATSGVFLFNLIQSSTVTVGMPCNLNTGEATTVGDGNTSCDCFTCSVEAPTEGASVYDIDNHRIGTAVSYGTSQTTVLCKIRSRIMDGPVGVTVW